ncbi:alpha-ribazole phosphatase [Desulfitispora alkaliphila]|uniref:alpha-ribazole phosphatase n=1 Tax=Desulfitispora alkaliphila TaxID=622674 RepID=UPI003D23C5AE
MESSKTELYLIRHGETEWNIAQRYQGHTDVGLSDVGREQTQLVAKRLKEQGVDIVYSSDLVRAHDTAKQIGLETGAEVIVNSDLRELNFGEWEGKTFTEIQNEYGDLVERWYRDPVNLLIPGGEKFTDLRQRSSDFVGKILEDNKGKRIAVVSHGGTIRTIICGLLDISLTKIWNFKQDNTAINIFHIFDQCPVVVTLNDSNHLG